MKKLIIALILISIVINAGFGQSGEIKSITISTSYNNLLSNPEKKGMLDRILTEVFKRIGVKTDIVYSSTANSLVDVNKGLADAEMNRIAGMESIYPNIVIVEEPNMIMEFVAFSKQQFDIDGWESIRNLEIGIVKGWKIYENNTAGFPNVTFVPTEAELFRMLDKNRIDIALYSKLTGYSHIKEKGYSGIFHLQPPLAEKAMYLYLHKSKAALAEPAAESLRQMKEDGTYQKIVKDLTKDFNE